MTLILSTIQPKAVVIVSDRRLSKDGVIVEEEATKLTVLVTEDARVCIAYTGVAISGVFRTEDWLIETLRDIANTTRSIYPILVALQQRASAEIPNTADSRLTFMICGFCYDNSNSTPSAWRLSNWEHYLGGNTIGEFQLIHESPSLPTDHKLLTAGNSSALSTNELNGARSLLDKGAPPHGIEAKLHSMIQGASRHPSSANTVGQQCNACVIQSDTNQNIVATYYSNRLSWVAYSVNSVIAIGPEPGAMCGVGGKLYASTHLSPAIVPKTRPNELCPCGSEQKYKKCHSKMTYPYWSFFVRKELNEPPYPSSGRLVVVESKGAAGA